MAQYNAGSLSILDGGTTATGVGTQFLGNVESGDYLLVFNQFNQSVHVATVTAVGSDTEVTFSPAYSGADLSGVTYAMTTDFTALKNLALMYPGDLGASDLFNRNMLAIEQALIDQDAKLSFEAVKHAAMSEAEFEAKRAQNSRLYKASGIIDEIIQTYNADGLVSDTLQLERNNRANVAGVEVSVGQFFKFQPAEKGLRTYDSATGASVVHADAATAFASETATNKVVVNRVDHYGIEVFLREVSTAQPQVYPEGDLHSDLAEMDGLATQPATRAQSFHAQFTGDTETTGRELNFWLLSPTAQAKVLSNPKNNLYFLSDGRLVQWCRRKRTIAGSGNDDWLGVSLPNTLLRFDANSSVSPQGVQDTVGTGVYRNSNHNSNLDAHKGLYTSSTASAAVNGQCYWLPLGNCLRLNQGGFHPSFNPMGTDFVEGTDGLAKFWHQDLSKPITSASDCFNIANKGSSDIEFGSIASGASGRPDDRFYDAIYADGQGGVVDLRLSAQGGTISDILGTEDARTKNGTQRGKQKLIRTELFAGTLTESDSGKNIYISGSGMGELATSGDTFSVYRSDGSVQTSRVDSAGVDGWVSEDTITSRELVTHVILSYTTSTSVSGEFSQTDVIGDPANILATPDLANGWLGNWVPVIPSTASPAPFPFTRKVVSGINDDPTLTSGFIANSAVVGGAWSVVSRACDVEKNEQITTLGDNHVQLFSYTAHAYMTEAADNPVVYKYDIGIGDSVFASENSALDSGVLLGESVVGKVVNQSVGTHPSVDSFRLLSGRTGSNSVLPTNVNHVPTHSPIDLIQPQNGGAYKALPLVAEENGQLFLYYLSTELIWDTTLDSGVEFTDRTGTADEDYTAGEYYHVMGGLRQGLWYCNSTLTNTNLDTAINLSEVDDKVIDSVGTALFTRWNGNGWGDDNLITVLDGFGTKPDLNGNTVKVSCTKVPYPLAWAN